MGEGSRLVVLPCTTALARPKSYLEQVGVDICKYLGFEPLINTANSSLLPSLVIQIFLSFAFWALVFTAIETLFFLQLLP